MRPVVVMARALKTKKVTVHGEKQAGRNKRTKSQMNKFVERIHVITRNLVQFYEIARSHRGMII